MITVTAGPLIVEPAIWTLVFDRKASTWWVSWLAMGKYKHVRAYAYVPFLHVWVFYDVNLTGTTIRLAADGPAAVAMIREFIVDCDLIRMPRREHATFRPPVLGWCVPSIKRLIGLRTRALRVDRLFRDCLDHGGELFEAQSHGRHSSPVPSRVHGGATGASTGTSTSAVSGLPATAG